MWRALFISVLVLLGAELVVWVVLIQAIGFWRTAALVLASSVLGGWLAKHQGLAALRRMQQRDPTEVPGLAPLEGLLLLIAGLLLLIPGLVSDIPGLLLLVPPVRRLVAKLIVLRLVLRMQAAGARASTTRPPPGWQARPPMRARDEVIDVQAERVDDPPLPPRQG